MLIEHEMRAPSRPAAGYRGGLLLPRVGGDQAAIPVLYPAAERVGHRRLADREELGGEAENPELRSGLRGGLVHIHVRAS